MKKLNKQNESIKYTETNNIDYIKSIIDQEIYTEIIRAETKHPTWPEDDFEALTILMEEVGEAAQAMLEEKYRRAPHENVHKEMVQCAAMAIRWLINDVKNKQGNK